jgi:hypothetical protein
LAFNLLPVGTANELQLRSTGETATIANIPVPGIYTFVVTATNPSGQTDDDEVQITCSPAFQVFTRWDDDGDADDIDTVYSRLAGVNDTTSAAAAAVQANALQGLVLKSGERTNYVTDATSVDILFTMLARANGTLSFSAQDLDGGAVTSLNSVTVTADTTATQEVTCNVTGLASGTYNIMATFSTTTGSTGSLSTDAVVHIQDALPTSVDVASNTVVAGLGVATSDATGPAVHGAFEASGYAGNVVKAWDLNNDGIDELVVLDNVGGTPVVTYFFTTPNPGNGQIINSANNEDDGNGNAFFDGTSIVINNANECALYGTTAAPADAAAGDFAMNVAAGFIDGDEYIDLVFGLQDASVDADEGRVVILYHDGSTTHGANYYNYSNAATTPRGARATIEGPDVAGDATVIDGMLFGISLAVGDVFGSDTPDDIVIGAPGDGGNSDEGRIYVFKGSATRYGGNIMYTAGDVADKEATGAATDDFFGIDVAVGNITGGAQQDVIVGMSDEAGTTAGKVLVFSNISNASAEIRSYAGDTAGDYFGRRIAVCNFNGTGVDDIVVSASDAGVGRVYVINDGRATFADIGALTDVPNFAGAAGEELGHLIATGDFDGDGLDDIVALADDTGNKAVLVSGTASTAATLAVATTFTNATGDAVGAAPEVAGIYDLANHNWVGFADVNGDTYDDIIICDSGGTVFRTILAPNR